ncbi:MAG TPA: nuclear transport factor 2 family protein [Longimicrobium sp.]|nr:nuclear transport factor 2 family protein [Longimicrobium sp.]
MAAYTVAAQPAPATPEAVVREHFAAQVAKDIERLMAVIADTLEVHPPPVEDLPATPGVFTWKEARGMYAAGFEMPSSERMELAQVIAAGNWVAARERYGTRGDSAAFESILVYQVRAGRVRGTWIFNGSMEEKDPRTPQAVREHVAAQAAHDLPRVMAVMGDSLEVHTGTAGRQPAAMVLDRAKVDGMYRGIFSRWPEQRIELMEIMASGEWVVTRERVTGMGLPGEPAEGMAVYRVHGGRIVGMWLFDPEQVR